MEGMIYSFFFIDNLSLTDEKKTVIIKIAGVVG